MDAKYTFVLAPNEKYPGFTDSNTQHLFMKWSLKNHFKVQSYVFSEPFYLHQKQAFVSSFFKDDTVVSTLLTLVVDWTHVGQPASSVEVEVVPCSIASMSVLKPLTDPSSGIVSSGGRIAVCPHGNWDGFLIADQLRNALLKPDSDKYQVIPSSLRQEFFFRIFEFVCLGGQWCQYEDEIHPYLDTTKLLYKDLVRVQKNAATNEISVRSVVLRVVAKDGKGVAYYPRNPEHRQNFAYLVVDPLRRQVTTFYHQFEGSYAP